MKNHLVGRLFFFTVCLICVVMVSGCKKNAASTYYIPQQFKDYGIFKIGSYWLYIDDSTGQIDSSYMKYTPEPILSLEYGQGTNTTWETCTIDYGGYFFNGTYLNPYQYDINCYTMGGSTCLRFDCFKKGYFFTNYDNTTLKTISLDDSLEVNGQKFHHVINTQFQSFVKGDSIKFTYYLVKSIGLIKFNSVRNQKITSWSLVRWHAIQ